MLHQFECLVSHFHKKIYSLWSAFPFLIPLLFLSIYYLWTQFSSRSYWVLNMKKLLLKITKKIMANHSKFVRSRLKIPHTQIMLYHHFTALILFYFLHKIDRIIISKLSKCLFFFHSLIKQSWWTEKIYLIFFSKIHISLLGLWFSIIIFIQ